MEPNKPRPKSGRPRKQTKQTITKIKNDSIMPANRKRQSEDKLKNITKKTKNDDSDFAMQPTVVLSKHNAKQIQKKLMSVLKVGRIYRQSKTYLKTTHM